MARKRVVCVDVSVLVAALCERYGDNTPESTAAGIELHKLLWKNGVLPAIEHRGEIRVVGPGKDVRDKYPEVHKAAQERTYVTPIFMRRVPCIHDPSPEQEEFSSMSGIMPGKAEKALLN